MSVTREKLDDENKNIINYVPDKEVSEDVLFYALLSIVVLKPKDGDRQNFILDVQASSIPEDEDINYAQLMCDRAGELLVAELNLEKGLLYEPSKEKETEEEQGSEKLN